MLLNVETVKPRYGLWRITISKTDRVLLMYISVFGYIFWIPNTLQQR